MLTEKEFKRKTRRKRKKDGKGAGKFDVFLNVAVADLIVSNWKLFLFLILEFRETFRISSKQPTQALIWIFFKLAAHTNSNINKK